MLTTNKKKSSSGFLVSVGILIFTIIATIGLHIYNGMLESKKSEIEATIKIKDSEIKELNSDPRVQVATLLTKNEVTLNRMQEHSQIPYFIEGVNKINEEYGLGLAGFNYSNGSVGVKSSILGGEGTQSYKKIVNFIDGYRNKAGADFTLGFINSFKTEETLDFQIALEVEDGVLARMEETSGEDKDTQGLMEKIRQRNAEKKQ